jgi:hypothetical protein
MLRQVRSQRLMLPMCRRRPRLLLRLRHSPLLPHQALRMSGWRPTTVGMVVPTKCSPAIMSKGLMRMLNMLQVTGSGVTAGTSGWKVIGSKFAFRLRLRIRNRARPLTARRLGIEPTETDQLATRSSIGRCYLTGVPLTRCEPMA